MNPNPDPINSPKINVQMAALKRLRCAVDKTLPMGWGDGAIPPPTANALEKAGLARIISYKIDKSVKYNVVAL